MRLERRIAAALAAVLLAAAALVGAEIGFGAISAGTYRPPNPCTQRTPIQGAGASTELQRIALDGLARAACRLGTTRVELALALENPAKRQRIAHGRDLNEILRESLLQAVDEQRTARNLGAIQAFLYRQAIEHTPVSLVKRVLGL